MNSGLPLRKTRFSEFLVRCNGLDEFGFEEWIFYPGMLFNTLDKWWGSGGSRNRPHEGLDLCFYRDKDRQRRRLDEKTRIPVMYEGEIAKIEADFLGKSIYVSHDIYNSEGNKLYTIYGHVQPRSGVQLNEGLREGDIIGTIANTAEKKTEIPSHLHISIAWMPSFLDYQELGWKTIGDPGRVILLNPLEVIGCCYTALSPGEWSLCST